MTLERKTWPRTGALGLRSLRFAKLRFRSRTAPLPFRSVFMPALFLIHLSLLRSFALCRFYLPFHSPSIWSPRRSVSTSFCPTSASCLLLYLLLRSVFYRFSPPPCPPSLPPSALSPSGLLFSAPSPPQVFALRRSSSSALHPLYTPPSPSRIPFLLRVTRSSIPSTPSPSSPLHPVTFHFVPVHVVHFSPSPASRISSTHHAFSLCVLYCMYLVPYAFRAYVPCPVSHSRAHLLSIRVSGPIWTTFLKR